MKKNSQQLKKMMSEKMSHRYHESYRPNNPNLRKSTAQKWFDAKVNKKKLPHDKVVPSKRPSYNKEYKKLPMDKFFKKFPEWK